MKTINRRKKELFGECFLPLILNFFVKRFESGCSSNLILNCELCATNSQELSADQVLMFLRVQAQKVNIKNPRGIFKIVKNKQKAVSRSSNVAVLYTSMQH